MARIFNLVAGGLALLLAIGLYHSKTEADRARARVAALEQEVASARTEIKTLAAEVAVLESPGRIEALARQKLGVAPAKPAQLHPLSDIDKTLPPPGAPAHASAAKSREAASGKPAP